MCGRECIVILSEAKDLLVRLGEKQILRCAQDDTSTAVNDYTRAAPARR